MPKFVYREVELSNHSDSIMCVISESDFSDELECAEEEDYGIERADNGEIVLNLEESVVLKIRVDM